MREDECRAIIQSAYDRYLTANMLTFIAFVRGGVRVHAYSTR